MSTPLQEKKIITVILLKLMLFQDDESETDSAEKSDSSENETEITRMPTPTPTNTEPEREKRGLEVEEVPDVAPEAEIPQEKTDGASAEPKDKEPKDIIKVKRVCNKLFARKLCKSGTAPINFSLVGITFDVHITLVHNSKLGSLNL
jgi:hypothetical protein